MENERLDEVVLLDEAGEPARFEHVLTFLYEKERYIALSPLLEEEEADTDEAEVIILKAEQKNGEETYVTIESEVLLSEVFDHFLDLMDELAEEAE